MGKIRIQNFCHMGMALTFLYFVTEHVDLGLARTGTLHNVQPVDFQLCSCGSFCSDEHRKNISVAYDASCYYSVQ